ncbi:glycine/betaine ABC transporter permease [Lentzea sp. NBRC 105346]|uniref:ABC transporter permease n=1 Tax=Lentzea sp. NBRC 105346 TaxID=3032205 RepID=UPI0024A2AE52|nr:ABC transporter permease [Lentzea sp. NBRC 105346]GLZ29895.1 glycine/betaine ABC transporter permease [Lentzea sp. NBRC 105346]
MGWLFDPAHWSGSTGIPVRIVEHFTYTWLTLLIAAVIAVPLGAFVGHTGRGGFLIVGLTNGLRALPTLAVLIIVVLWAGIGDVPVYTALVLLAVPPIMAGTYAGIRAVEPSIVDAARGVGMHEGGVLLQVELPNALPLVFGGFRGAALQVVSTATIAAYVGAGGLGRFVFDGLAFQEYDQMLGGAVLVAVLAVLVDLVFVGLQKLTVSPGVVGAGSGGNR